MKKSKLVKDIEAVEKAIDKRKAKGPLLSSDLLNGVELIRLERDRQISKEGWTLEHDDGHRGGEMAWAAACYAGDVAARLTYGWPMKGRIRPSAWPWQTHDWKPTRDKIRQLVKAGALIAAEIDRLRRADGGRAVRIRKMIED